MKTLSDEEEKLQEEIRFHMLKIDDLEQEMAEHQTAIEDIQIKLFNNQYKEKPEDCN